MVFYFHYTVITLTYNRRSHRGRDRMVVGFTITWVLIRQFYQLPRCINMNEKFVTNVSFDTVRLINHPWDRIKCLTSCLIKKKIFFLLLRGGNICFYCHNTLKAYFLTFSKCDGNKFNGKSIIRLIPSYILLNVL
jgi:hypothetical protein